MKARRKRPCVPFNFCIARRAFDKIYFKMIKKKYLLLTLGFLFIPVFFILFISDRMLLALLFWIESKPISKWWLDTELMLTSLIRVTFVCSVYFIYSMVLWATK